MYICGVILEFRILEMCYNYDIMQKKLDREFPDLTGTLYDPAEMDDNPFHSAFTFRKGPVIIRGEVNELHYYHWGLIPMWTKSLEDAKKIRTQTLNARSETVFEKPSFRASITKKRCLIIRKGATDSQIKNEIKKLRRYVQSNFFLSFLISESVAYFLRNYFLLRVSMRAGLTARRANYSIPILCLPWMPTP
jgi:hypothetical protein